MCLYAIDVEKEGVGIYQMCSIDGCPDALLLFSEYELEYVTQVKARLSKTLGLTQRI